MQRSGFAPRMKNRQVVIEMSAHLLAQGLATREVKNRLDELYHVDVSLPTITSWAKKQGVKLKDRKRLKPCRFCGSRTRHKSTCPVAKVQGPKEDKLERFSAYLV